MRAVIIFVVLALGGVPARGSGFSFGEEHSLPVAWSAPELSHQDGKLSFVPAFPTEFKTVRLGAGLKVGRAAAVRVQSVPIPPEYDVRLRDGSVVRAVERRPFVVNGRRFRILGVRGRQLLVQSVSSGRVLSLSGRRWRRAGCR